MEYEVSKTVAVQHVGVWSRRADQLALWFLGIDQSLAWYEGVSLYSMRLTKKDGEWMLVLKATRGKRKGLEAVCAFVYGHNFAEVLETLAMLITRRELQWVEDKYPQH